MLYRPRTVAKPFNITKSEERKTYEKGFLGMEVLSFE